MNENGEDQKAKMLRALDKKNAALGPSNSGQKSNLTQNRKSQTNSNSLKMHRRKSGSS